ncbi:MAG TPA: tetratricopeptide repeat protein [Polyangiaceae bacterium LLY-WYZ-15_(1-7)]|nr:hypothetical protein [Myxococcales bacterium]HJL05127.1 tetratricopeptide repeat protein [Polyangiaceae bacterium LLY-WYZ-15_(1-7)]HJL10380.1 tetratricopeptide repeat protein [Polyangiaceae bacterium LLY-WYZ-15_(1-7)]HJL25676.1 tetratricopeptide repeat protein [Polyangiaceae bacterium LLY-WYZ-15_(1-7)]HJL36151.1 tetratricopeptide repeat protein [Polyangiaceae bacterium LLY-WYZ-15_(1-7)]
MSRRPQRLSFALALLTGLGFSAVAPASAQDAAVVRRLVQFGQMEEGDARDLVRKVDRVLAADAERGGDRFDTDLRRETHQALFGNGPPPRAEYYERIQAVKERLAGGLTSLTLPVHFQARPNASVLCAHAYGITIGECDALIAAATETPAALPYLPPDDGRALVGELRSGRVNRRVAREIASKLRDVMLGVPRNLTNDQRGRALLQLMEQCPGGTSDREAQVRAWHVGPTPGLARCIAGAIARRGGASMAQGLFELSPNAAQAFLSWGAPGASAQPTPPTPPTPPRTRPPRNPPPRNSGSPQVSQMSAPEALRQQARAQFRLRNYPAALSAYEQASQLEPDHAGTWAGVGACKAAMRDYPGAITAYSQAVRLAPENDGYFVSLGRAYAQNGQREAAIGALQQAMRIDRNNMSAREGLRALGGEPPPPPLPEVPPRDAIIATMRPLEAGVAGCSPTFSGRVVFHLIITGETGEVTGVSSEGVEDPNEAACMESVVQSARFPRFTREELTISYPFEIAPPE